MVAEVQVDPDCPFTARPGDLPDFVMGSFTAGEAFGSLRTMLDAFEAVYVTGDREKAGTLHEEIDRLGLIAVDDVGRRYRVSNVYFSRHGLLFSAI
jgi:hypothetical protein